MEPTTAPWWPHKRRVLLPSAHYRSYNIHSNWSRSRNPDITVYFGRDESARIFSRLENALGQSRLFPTRAPWHERYHPLDMDPWQLSLPTPPDHKSGFVMPAGDSAPAVPAVGAGSGAGAAAGASRWENAARGWAAGTVLLAVLVLIVRAMEKCIDRTFFKAARRRSHEWPTPNVLATSGQGTTNIDIGLDNQNGFQSDSIQGIPNDLPPPYSECANGEVAAGNADSGKLRITHEEPPPPYSACYVAFLNPKHGIPSVHLHHGRRRMLFDNGNTSTDTTYTDDSNGNIAESEGTTSDREFSENTRNVGNANVELVFENGRVIESAEFDPNIPARGDAGAASADVSTSGTEHGININDNNALRQEQVHVL